MPMRTATLTFEREDGRKVVWNIAGALDQAEYQVKTEKEHPLATEDLEPCLHFIAHVMQEIVAEITQDRADN